MFVPSSRGLRCDESRVGNEMLREGRCIPYRFTQDHKTEIPRALLPNAYDTLSCSVVWAFKWCRLLGLSPWEKEARSHLQSCLLLLDRGLARSTSHHQHFSISLPANTFRLALSMAMRRSTMSMALEAGRVALLSPSQLTGRS